MSDAEVRFVLNGAVVRLAGADILAPLSSTLRQLPGLTGTKVACGQGNCGACTVTVHWPKSRVAPECVNACLLPTGALLVSHDTPEEELPRVVTVEGATAVAGSPCELAGRAIAECNGSQCGFCTPGMVMKAAYYAGLVEHGVAPPDGQASPRDVEDLLNGNLCRCTGYRPILYALKSRFAHASRAVRAEMDQTPPLVVRGEDARYARSYSSGDLRHPHVTVGGVDEEAKPAAVLAGESPARAPEETAARQLHFHPRPDADHTRSRSVAVVATRAGEWHAPRTRAEALALLSKHAGVCRLVAGNVNAAWVPLDGLPEGTVYVSIAGLGDPDLHARRAEPGGEEAFVGALVPLAALHRFFAELDPAAYDAVSIAALLFAVANLQVRHLATVGGNVVAAQRRDGILLTEVGMLFAALRGRMVIAAEGLPEHEVSVEAFLRSSDGTIPAAYAGRWMATGFKLTLPVRAKGARVRVARVASRAENHGTLCTAAYVRSAGVHAILFTGPRKVNFDGLALLVGTIPLPAAPEAGAVEPRTALRHVVAALSRDGHVGRDLSSEDRRLVGQVAARVLGVDAGPGDEITASLLEERKQHGQRGAQSFFVRPEETPTTEPIVKDAAYLHYRGQALYPQDVLPPTGAMRGTPILIPTAITTFDPAALKEHAARLIARTLPELAQDAVILSAADMPMPSPGEAVVPHAALGHDHMFTRRNVIVDESFQSPEGRVQPGAFGEFLMAPGVTTFAGQVIAVILHPSELGSRRLAAVIQGAVEADLGGGPASAAVFETTTGKHIFTDHTATHAVLTIDESRKRRIAVPQPVVHACGSESTYTGSASAYEAMWARLASTEGVVVAELWGEAASPVVAGSQSHMYMETQNAIVQREEDRWTITSSTQSMTDVAGRLSPLLGVTPRDVVIRNLRIGGGFGGKTMQSVIVAGLAAMGVLATGRPTQVSLDRRLDFDMIGKRHFFHGRYRVAVEVATGRMLAMQLRYDLDAGCSSDVTTLVMARCAISSNGMYDVPEFRCTATGYLTHKQSATAMRSFGVVQATTITETAVDHALHLLNTARARLAIPALSPEDFRARNFYREGAGKALPQTPYKLAYAADGVTPRAFDEYGQELLQTELMNHPTRGAWAAATGDAYQAAVREAAAFNAKNTWRKRAVAALPLLYGAGFEVAFLAQNPASVGIYVGGGPTNAGAGYVLVHQAGIEMGQGVHIGIRQAAAAALGAPISVIRLAAVSTDSLPNMIGNASTGTDLNLPGVVDACTTLRRRLELTHDRALHEILEARVAEGRAQPKLLAPFDRDTGYARAPGDAWKAIKAHFAQHPVGPGPTQHLDVYVAHDRSWRGDEATWAAVVTHAFMRRVPLVAVGYSRPDADGDREMNHRNLFAYFTYATAWSLVEVDGLTGQTDVLRTDVHYDCGGSVNPAVDIGQIEGGFVQGLGNVVTENVTYDRATGRLDRRSFLTYAMPDHRTVPRELNVHLFWLRGDDAAHGVVAPIDHRHPERRVDVKARAKTSGEPPLVLGVSVLLAIRHAVQELRRSVAAEQGAPADRAAADWVSLSTPMTPAAMLRAIWGERCLGGSA